MAVPMTLAEYQATVDVPAQLDREWLLQDFLAPLGIRPDDGIAAGCEDALLALAGAADGSLRLRPGGWQISLGPSVARTLLSAVLVAGALSANGHDEITIETAVAVLPSLVGLERVRLDRRERALLVPVRRASSGLEGRAVHPQVLYERLDKTVRDQVNYLDFVAFCERLIAAGEMDDGGYDEIKPRQAGSTAWIRLTW